MLMLFVYRYSWLTAYGWPASSIVQMAEGWMILLVTIHRYLAVCHPTLNPRWTSIKATRLHIAVVMLSSIIFNMPRFFEYTVEKDGDMYIRKKTNMNLSINFQIGYKAATYYVLVFLIPVLVLIVLTTLLIIALHKNHKKRRDMMAQSPTTQQRQKEEITIALVVVVVVFVLCQMTNPIRRILEISVPYSQRGCGSFYNYFAPLSGFSILLNSAVNFPIFCLCGQGFRKKTAKKLCWFVRSNAISSSTQKT